MRRATKLAEKMIKVDHAGENGAVNIYRAQALVAQFRARSILADLIDFKKHEERHRQLFSDYLDTNGIRRCVSYHLCGFGGFALGFFTGLMGPKAIFATTYAVENVVLEHLQYQLGYLKSHDSYAYNCVNEIVIDELEHHDTAASQIDPNSILTKALIKIVKLCTEAVIGFGMR